MQGMHPAQFFAMMGHAFPAAMQMQQQMQGLQSGMVVNWGDANLAALLAAQGIAASQAAAANNAAAAAAAAAASAAATSAAAATSSAPAARAVAHQPAAQLRKPVSPPSISALSALAAASAAAVPLAPVAPAAAMPAAPAAMPACSLPSAPVATGTIPDGQGRFVLGEPTLAGLVSMIGEIQQQRGKKAE